MGIFNKHWNKFKRVVNSCYLCIKYPFLYPRNRFTNRHYTNWKIERYLDGKPAKYNTVYNLESKRYESIIVENATDGIYGKAFTTIQDDDGVTHDVIGSYYWFLWYKIVSFYYNILSIFHCIPTYTELDAMPKGWRNAFGLKMCDEIKAQLKKDGCLYTHRIIQIKEKFGYLHYYYNRGSNSLSKIVCKYEKLSGETCIFCGKPATIITAGYFLPYCQDCYDKIDGYRFIYKQRIDGNWKIINDYE